MKITVSLEKVLPRIHSHLSIIGKRAVNQHGERFYEELTTSSHEDSIFSDLMCSASESIVSSISDICVYYEDSKGVTFEIINERWAKLDEKLSHDLTEALEGSIYRYIVFYCLGVFLSSIFPALSQEKFPTFGKTYLEMAESILKRVVDLSYLKRPDNFAGLTYDEMFRASSEEFEGNKIGLFTIQRNGTTISSYNGTADKIADINVPVNVSELKNDSGYLDSITAELVCDALGYTPFDENAFTKSNIREIAEIPSWAWGAKPKYSWYEINGLDEELEKKYDSSRFETDFDKTIKKYELGREFVKIGTGQFISDVYRNGNTVYFQTGDIGIPDSGSNVSWGEKTDSSVVLSVDNIKYALTLYKEDLFVREVRDGKVVIKAKYPLYSVGDISAYGYSEGNLPSGGVTSFSQLEEVINAGVPKEKKYWGWDNGYKWLDAPEGGGTTNFAALTLVINGLNEQYFPTGDNKIFDLDAVYAKKGEGGNVNLDDYYKKTEITTLLEGYVTNDTLVTTVKDVKAYTGAQIKALDINQYAKTADIQQWVDGKDYATNSALDTAIDGAKSYANGKFVTKADNWEVIDGIKMLNGTYTFFKTLYIEPDTSYGAYIGWQDGPAAMNILKNGRIKLRQGIQDNIELYGSKDAQNNGVAPFLDFHFNDTVTDFSSRIIESAKGILEIQNDTQLNGTLKIGNAYLTYDSENNALFVTGKGGTSVNLVATGDVAAYSGLGSGFDMLTDLTLTNKLTVKTIACSGNAIIDGELECTGEITTAYMSIDDVTIGSSITLDNDHIFMGLSNGAYIEFATNGRTSQLSDVWINNDKQVCITINGKEYKIATIQE